MNRFSALLLIMFLFGIVCGEEIFFESTGEDTIYFENVIVENTLRITDKNGLLEKGKDYYFEHGKLFFQEKHDSVRIQFSSFEKNLKYKNLLYEKIPFKTDGYEIHEDIGKREEIAVRGSNGILVGVSGAGGLEVEQSLDLQIEGVVADRWKVSGSIYDNSGISEAGVINIPISQLENINLSIDDSVNFIELGNQRFLGGDGVFTSINREIIGLSYTSRRMGSVVEAAVASQKGKVKNIRFQLINSVWGPYVLVEEQTLYEYVIAPGSEEIYLNGNLLSAGEDKDYTINYQTGELYFSNTVDVDSTKQVYAEFQTYEYFAPLTGYYSKGSIADGKIEYVFIREEQSIVEEKLREQLMYASSDTSFIISSGEIFLGEGNGSYQKIDSVYVYAGEGGGSYDVEFTYVGYGQGTYIYSPIINAYLFVGAGGGYYEPFRKIDLPFESNYAGAKVTQKIG